MEDVTSAEAAVDAEPIEDPAKELERLKAERDMLVMEKDLLTMERETLRDSLAAVSAEKAAAEEAITEKTTLAADALRELAAKTQAHQDAVDAIPMVRREAQTLLDMAQRDINATALERDAALGELRRAREDVVIEVSQGLVDHLELPWDGPAALPGQLRAMVAELKELRGKTAQ